MVHETHASWVFLAGEYAYKVKKPITTSFLDYGTLAKREQCCDQEFRLNRRYATDLYLGVVPITSERGTVQVEGSGEIIEFAVKMRRFPEDALLSQRLDSGKIANEEVFQLAATVAEFHEHAAPSGSDQRWGSPSIVLKEATDNFHDLRATFRSSPQDAPGGSASTSFRRGPSRPMSSLSRTWFSAASMASSASVMVTCTWPT